MIPLTIKLKRSLCLLLCLLLCCLTATPSFAAVQYPFGVTPQAAGTAVGRTDVLVKNAVPAMTGKTLGATIYETLFSDETLSSILLGLYQATESQNGGLSSLGVDASPSAVANGLSAYPSVQQKLRAAASWNDVNLSGAAWHVTTKAGFAAAVSAMAMPFNDLLYMLLCGGDYRMGLLTLRGDNGYQNGVVPILSALGCPSIPSAASFLAQANTNRTLMLYQIVLSVLSLVDVLAVSPMQKLTLTLPDLAIFIRDGGLEKAVDELLRPISLRIGPFVQLFSGSQMLRVVMFLQDPASLTRSFAENVTGSVNDMLSQSGFTIADIDLDAFAACKGNSADCYVTVMRWLVNTMKMNKDALSSLTGAQGGADTAGLLDPILNRETDELVFIIVHLLTTNEGMPLDYTWSDAPFTPVTVEYTENLGKAQFKRVLKGIDSTIGEFTSSFGGEDLQTTLGHTLYSSDTVTALAKQLYGALSGEETRMLGAMLGLPGSPAALASMLPSGFSGAKSTLSRYGKWENLSTVNWGVTKGDRESFKRALTAMLRPTRPVLEALLTNGTLTLFGALHLPGTNGYQTAIIPLLEALNCPSDKIKTYDAYCKGKGTDAVLTDLLDPVLALTDKLIKKPVYTLTALLPNAMFFFENGSLSQCLENLMYPLTETMRLYGMDLSSFGVEESALQLDGAALKTMLAGADLPIDISSLDLSSISGMGTPEERLSKRGTDDEPVPYVYIKAEKTAVLVTLLRAVVDMIRDPANADMLNDMLGSGTMPATFEQFSAGLGDQFADMTTDETIEWLYHLFFRERAVKEEIEDDGYEPHIIYTPPPSHAARNVGFTAIGLIAVAGVVILVWRRKEIERYFARRKEEKRLAAENTNEEV